MTTAPLRSGGGFDPIAALEAEAEAAERADDLPKLEAVGYACAVLRLALLAARDTLYPYDTALWPGEGLEQMLRVADTEHLAARARARIMKEIRLEAIRQTRERKLTDADLANTQPAGAGGS